ncbi:MAG: protein kinase domain-containing protein [Planctomycetota bacterium]|jgi:serine/threonine protein kinase
MTKEYVQPGDDRESLVVEIVEDFLHNLEQGGDPQVDEYAQRYPDIADVLRQVLPVLSMVGATSDVWSQTERSSDSGPCAGRTIGDFKIIREIGRGGMGVVYEAQEISLGRHVALKLLPFVAVLDPRQLKRFKMEAQIAACLHHTNIVPVYSVGCERGVHYYAMQYIEGYSLASIIQELRQHADVKKPADQRDHSPFRTGLSKCASSLLAAGSTESPEFIRSITHIGIQAAEALQHAHDMGIVHRDIKPSNLLLDMHGHLWITDFGLAQHRANAATALTMPGDVLGTIRYMSPEQVAGHTSVLDHRTDIYAMGATLFELLALEPVFTDRERHRLLRSIEIDEPRSLRLLNPAVPTDLETIVLKAMAKESTSRYASSQALADDLQRFLEHKTIKAKRPTFGERLAKWSRRHRTLVAAAVLILVIAVFALSLSTVLIWQEEARTKAALTQVDDERQRAQANYEKAREAVDEITHIVEAQLANPATVKKTRKELLQKALLFYEGFLETNSQDPNVMIETCHSYRRIGSIHMRLGQYDQAGTACTSAIDLSNRVYETSPGNLHVQRLLGDCLVDLCLVLMERGKMTESVDNQRQAIRIFAQISAQKPTDRNRQEKLLGQYKRLAKMYKWMGEHKQTIEAIEKVLELEKELANRYPRHLDYQKSLAIDQAELAQVIWATGQRTKAVEQAREAVDRLEHIVLEFPDQLDGQYSHVRVRMILADLLRRSEQKQEATEHYVAAKEFHKRLLTLPAEDSSHWGKLAWNEKVMAGFLRENGQINDAIEMYGQASQHDEKAIALKPHEEKLRRSLAADYCYRLGPLLIKEGRLDEAQQIFARAQSLCEQLMSEVPDRFEHNAILIRVYIGLGDIQRCKEQYSKASSSIQQAMQLQDELVRTCPVSARWSWRLGWGPGRSILRGNYERMGELLTDLGDAEQAAEAFRKATHIDPNSNDN